MSDGYRWIALSRWIIHKNCTAVKINMRSQILPARPMRMTLWSTNKIHCRYFYSLLRFVNHIIYVFARKWIDECPPDIPIQSMGKSGCPPELDFGTAFQHWTQQSGILQATFPWYALSKYPQIMPTSWFGFGNYIYMKIIITEFSLITVPNDHSQACWMFISHW